jgi:hypothetical protein
MPVTGGYLAARDAWSSGWSSAVSSFAVITRSMQASLGGNSADFGGTQLQGFGSARNMDYIAKRWAESGDRYIVGSKATGTQKWVDQSGAGITVSGMGAWIAARDKAVRELVAREMDAKVAAFIYRQVFVDHVTVNLAAMEFTRTRRFHGKVTGQETVTVPARTREYVGSPVASGYSRSRMDLIWIIRGDDLVGQFISRAPYSLIAPAVRGWWNKMKRGMGAPVKSAAAAITAGAKNG